MENQKPVALLLAEELVTIIDHQDARYPNIGAVSQAAAAQAVAEEQERLRKEAKAKEDERA